MRVTVQPAADGFDMRGNWVTKKGAKSVPSTKKSAAKRKARELANEGDTLIVKGTDGKVLSGYPRTYRGEISTDSSSSSRGLSARDSDDTGRDSSRFGFRDKDRDGGSNRSRVEGRRADDDIDDFDGVEFRDPVEGTDFIRDDFEENKTNVESTLDDLF